MEIVPVGVVRETSFSTWENIIGNKIPLITLRPIAKQSPPPEILIIYGGSIQPDFRYEVKRNWAEPLAHLGFSVHCFDFRSNVAGEDFYQFGLSDRLADVIAVVNWLRRQSGRGSLTLVGISMGGHLAVQMAAELGRRLANLILVAPAAYHHQAMRKGLKFSPPGTAEDGRNPRGEFTRILRQSEFWRESEIFSVAEKQVKTRALIIRFDQDKVVGEAPLEYVLSFIKGDLFWRLTTLPGDHRSTSDSEKMKLVIEAIARFVNSGR